MSNFYEEITKHVPGDVVNMSISKPKCTRCCGINDDIDQEYFVYHGRAKKHHMWGFLFTREKEVACEHCGGVFEYHFVADDTLYNRFIKIAMCISVRIKRKVLG